MGNETEKEALDRFAEAMYAKISKSRKNYKPFGWRDPVYKTIKELQRHLFSEVGEWGVNRNDLDELVDIANSAMMLWDRLKHDTLQSHKSVL